MEDGRARLRLVEVAERSASEVAIAGGLEPGARLILHPTDKVADGLRVTVR